MLLNWVGRCQVIPVWPIRQWEQVLELQASLANIHLMKPMNIKIKPADRSACRFTVEQSLTDGEIRFSRSMAPHGHEMADAILGLPGIDEVVISGDTVTVLKSDERDWRELEDPIA